MNIGSANTQRIGLIGDVHAEDGTLSQALQHMREKQVDVTLCTGDIVDGLGSVDACVRLLTEHNVYTVRGNHDRWLLQDKARHIDNAHHRHDLNQESIEYLQNLPTELLIDTCAGTLLLCHGIGGNDLQKVWPGTERMPVERSPRLDTLIAQGQINWLINGHMHYRTIIHFHGLTLINAGTLRGDHHPGVSILDLSTMQLEGYEFDPQVHMVRRLHLDATDDTEVFVNTQSFDGDWQPITLYA